MKQSEWSDKQLENLLQRMPHFKDHRDPQEIYQNITLKYNNKRKNIWTLPGYAAATVALVLLILLLPDLLKIDHSLQSSGKTKLDTFEIMAADDKKEELNSEIEIKAGSIDQNQPISRDESPVAFAKEMEEPELVASQSLGQKGEYIKTEASSAKKEQSAKWMSDFKEEMSHLSKLDLGLTSSHSAQDSFRTAYKKDEEAIGATNKQVKTFHNGSGAQNTLMNLPEDSGLSAAVSGSKPSKENQEENTVEHYGGESKMLNSPPLKRAYFLGDNHKIPSLIPSQNTYENIEGALEAMKYDLDGTELKRSLPSTLKLTIRVDGQQLFLNFEQLSDIKNDESTLQVFEAILLTAREFDFVKVRFENLPFTKLGSLDFSQAIEVSEAMGRKSLP